MYILIVSHIGPVHHRTISCPYLFAGLCDPGLSPRMFGKGTYLCVKVLDSTLSLMGFCGMGLWKNISTLMECTLKADCWKAGVGTKVASSHPRLPIAAMTGRQSLHGSSDPHAT